MRIRDWSSDVCSSDLLDPTKACATTASTGDEGRSMKGCFAGLPFPIPQTGSEVMWNHLLRFEGVAQQVRYRNFNVSAGHPTLSVEADATEEYTYWDPAKKGSNTSWRLKLVRSEERRGGKGCGRTGKYWW